MGMQHQRHLGPTHTLKHSFEPTMMISMPMREHHRAQIADLHVKDIHIVQNRPSPKSCIIHHRLATIVTVHSQEQRIAMLSDQLLTFRPVLGQRHSLRYLCARCKNINDIIYQNGDVCYINR